MTVEILVGSLPPAVAVPAGWVLEQLQRQAATTSTPVVPVKDRDVVLHVDARHAGDALKATEWLTTAEFGRRHEPPRTAEWVRDQCRAGEFETAERIGGQWRIAATDLVGRSLGQQPARVASAAASTSGGPADVVTSVLNVGDGPLIGAAIRGTRRGAHGGRAHRTPTKPDTVPVKQWGSARRARERAESR